MDTKQNEGLSQVHRKVHLVHFELEAVKKDTCWNWWILECNYQEIHFLSEIKNK